MTAGLLTVGGFTACDDPAAGEIEIRQATGTVIGNYSNGFVSILVQVDEEYPIGKTIEYVKAGNVHSPAYVYLPESEEGIYLNVIQVQADSDQARLHENETLTNRRISFSYRPFQKKKDLEELFVIGVMKMDAVPPDVPIYVITNYQILND
jgi:hypothetical protein